MARKPATASRLLAAALALLAAAVRSRAVDAEAAAPAAAAESATAEPRVQPPAPPPALPPIVRDPFWPVGFDPAPPSTAPVAASQPDPAPPPQKLAEPGPGDWAAARRQLKPNVGSGVNPDGSERFFAFMNNRLIAPGQTVKVETPLFSFAWRIARIDADGVAFTPVEARRLGDGARFAPPPTDK